MAEETTERPWGTYTILESTKSYKIKRIVVNPKKKLSLQSHFHRSEHWVVVDGVAWVTIDTYTNVLFKNKSTFIPPGAKHRLENPGLIPLELIEVQIGEYLEEDDITRYDDDFGRSSLPEE